jgi:hypothetical protein
VTVTQQTPQYFRGFVVDRYPNGPPHDAHTALTSVPFRRYRFESRAWKRHLAEQ